MRIIDRLVGFVENAEILDKPADKAADIADSVLGGERVRDTLSGTWLGHPLHPLMVTIPIGSWAAASVLDFTGGKEMEGAARRLIGLGILSVAPTAAAGISDWRYTMGKERRVGAVHAVANTVAVTLYGASWLARGRGARTAGIVLALGGASVMSVSGYLGGHLSYASGVGVDNTAFENLPEDWTTVAQRSEITGDGLFERRLNGVSILLSEVDGEVRAIANKCTHRGGPLHEGRREGDCVRCPWHDSSFSLVDGEVEVGPATRPQPTYDVRTVDGEVQVREGETTALRSESVGAGTP